MIQRTNWVDRKFNLNLPPGWLHNVLSRLRGTEARILALTEGLDDKQLSETYNDDKWSVKQHIGHLTDLESLHDGRIDDFIARKAELRPADMSNTKTHQSDHNAINISELISEFSKSRNAFIDRLYTLDDHTQQVVAIHPRLNVEMKIVDMAYFTAEHDDHHLASIFEQVSIIEQS